MTKHTPGPWKTQKCYEGIADEYQIALVFNGSKSGDKDFDIIAPTGSYEQGYANARLIAAAPELLEACEASHNAKTQADLDRAVIMIEAAIAKARGEQ